MSGRQMKVKNKAAAETQITAEQIMREAQQYREVELKLPKQRILDAQELEEFRLQQRKFYEDKLRLNRSNFLMYTRYAAWEESQGELDKARSILERAIDEDYRVSMIWLKYGEMEMRAKAINHARNIWERATDLLPRFDQFWLKYIHMEEMLGDIVRCREVFEKWMKVDPVDDAWIAYYKFELKYKEVENARQIVQRYVSSKNTLAAWLRYAKFEAKVNEVERERAVYLAASDALEVEVEKAEVLGIFEKKFGEKKPLEVVVVEKCRKSLEEELRQNPQNYDAWLDYARLEEGKGDIEKVRRIFRRATSNVPPGNEKRLWRRYVYLWLYWATFEELVVKDVAMTREVFENCVKTLPKKVFFAKVWILFAKFEIRQKELQRARKVFGVAIGKSRSEKVFREYIHLEFQLGEMDRCRSIYNSFLTRQPLLARMWVDFAKLEVVLGEEKRARAIFELALTQDDVDAPEVIWKAYIDAEMEWEQLDNANTLYERLLETSTHVKVFVSYAQFWCLRDDVNELARSQKARSIFNMGNSVMKREGRREDRALLMQSWKAFEDQFGDDESRGELAKIFPKKLRKRRLLKNEDGTDAGWEEYIDFQFPDEREEPSALRFLEAATKWKESSKE